MLKETERPLNDDVLEDGARGDVDRAAFCSNDNDSALQSDTATEVDGTSNSEMVKLQHLRNGRDMLLKVGDLLEIATELDEWRVSESSGAHLKLTVLKSIEVGLDKHEIGAGLDRQEAATGNVDTVCILKVANSGTNSSLKLNNGDIRLTLLVTRDGLSVGDDLHLKLIVLNNTLNSVEVKPDVVRVEVLELLDRLELIDMLLGDLSNFKKTDRALVVDNSTTLDIGLGLVGQFHNVLSLGLHHVLKDAEINHATQVINVGEEDNLNSALKKLVKNTRVVERLENVTVARGVPLANRGFEVLGDGKKRILIDSGVSGLVEGEDIDVVSFILLNDSSSVVVGVEGVHKNERNVDVVCVVKILNLTDREIEERRSVTNFDDGLGANTTHRGTKTTVELENSKLVEELHRLGGGKVLIIDDLTLSRRSDTVPVTVA